MITGQSQVEEGWLRAAVLWTAFCGGSSWELPHSQPLRTSPQPCPPSAVLNALADFGPDAAGFGCIAAVARADGLKKTAVRHVCMYPFAVKYIGDKYALIILCVVEGVLQFRVHELCPGFKFLFMV